MKDTVVVKSKTINNESIPVIFNIAEVVQGGVIDKREISRSFVFRDFKCEMLLKYANILVKSNPDEYTIIDGASEELSDVAKRKIRVGQEKEQGFICQYCNAVTKSKAGLTAHIRFQHKEIGGK